MPSGSSTSNTSTTTSYSFEAFFHGWCNRQEELSAEITAVVEDGKFNELEERAARVLVARVLGHFEEYYEHKSRAAYLDSFALFSPSWCTGLDCALLWITGFRPMVLLQLVSDTVRDSSPDQTRALDRLKTETKINEKAVEDEFARIQEMVAAPPLINVIREGSAWSSEQQPIATSEPVEQLRSSFEAVIADADSLRVTTGTKLAEILTPYQYLKFLVAAIRFLQGLRTTETQRDTNR